MKIKRLLNFIIIIIAAIIVFNIVSGIIDKMHRNSYPKMYSEYVEKYSSEYDVDEYLVYAIIKTESGFNPEAVSYIGARGLMQIMEDTYDWTKFKLNDERENSYDDMYDPVLNIQYGTYLISVLIEEFRSWDTAIAAYHAGRGNVKKWLADPELSSDGVDIDDIPIKETGHYVSKVNKAYNNYIKIYKKSEEL